MSLNDAAAGPPTPPASPPPGMRRVSDARTLRALAHPVRIALIEALSLGGAMTATELAEQISESPTTCSFHLRQLAKYGFVEEAGGGKGRARPWRMTSIGMEIPIVDDPEATIAATTLARLLRERVLGRYRTWVDTSATYPREWREAAGDSEFVLYMTAEELRQLNDDVRAVAQSRFTERLTDPSLRPPGAVPVEMLIASYPLSLPPADADNRKAES